MPGETLTKESTGQSAMISKPRSLVDIDSQNGHSLDRLAALLRNVVEGWRLADQKQRNRMARGLLNGVLVRDKQVMAVRPKKELEPFFKISYECQEESLAGDPDRI